MSTLDIAIVNWNAGDQLRDCLASIPRAVSGGVHLDRVVVVDNASTDGSVDGLEDLDLPLRVIRNAENRGFAAACNQGAEGGIADSILFLNPDTRLLPESLGAPMQFMDDPANAHIGIVGIQLVGDDGEVARTSVRFPTAGQVAGQTFGLDRLLPKQFPPHFMSEWDHGDTRAVDQVIGAFLWIRRPVFEALGGFDERFFVYYEELDLSLRARLAGHPTYFLANAKAYHRGGGTTDQAKAARLFYNLRSRIVYGHKHFSPLAAAALTVLTLTVDPLTRLAFYVGKRDWRSVSETVGGFRRLWRQAPSLLVGRPRTDG